MLVQKPSRSVDRKPQTQGEVWVSGGRSGGQKPHGVTTLAS